MTDPTVWAREITRFDLEGRCDGESGRCRAAMEPCIGGDYVGYDDHAAALQAAEQRAEIAEAGAEAWTRDAEACECAEAEVLRLSAVYEAASRWSHWGKVKAMHVLTCAECERLEGTEDRWCAEAGKIARAQLGAAGALNSALDTADAALRRERKRDA